jgi:hypothetical protein
MDEEEKAMNKTALKISVFAAAMLASAGILPAQMMKAEIPFSFEASGARMQAGTYSVGIDRSAAGQAVVRLLNWDTRKSVLALPSADPARRAVSTSAVITFLCTEAGCALQQVRDSHANVYRFHPARAGHGDARIATVQLRTDRAD